MRRVRSKASRLLSYDWQPAHAPDVAQRRQRGLRLLAQGHATSEVARRVGVTDQTVRRWNTEAKAAA
jgi:DNA-binding NarL/FixJ family response regulator